MNFTFPKLDFNAFAAGTVTLPEDITEVSPDDEPTEVVAQDSEQ